MMSALFGELGASDHFCRSMAALGVQVRMAAVSRFGRLSLTWTGGAGSGPTRSVRWTWANPGLLLLVTDGLFLVPILHH
jgi:hypothetical protein